MGRSELVEMAGVESLEELDLFCTWLDRFETHVIGEPRYHRSLVSEILEEWQLLRDLARVLDLPLSEVVPHKPKSSLKVEWAKDGF